MSRKNKLEELYTKYRENRLAHAYLIETNKIEDCLEDLLEIIKKINCKEEYSENCNKCNICNLIQLNNLPSLSIIEPDGTVIKKNQIQELKLRFSTKPIYTKNNIYIIKNAEKLNASSANTMLKFLEEPDGQVIGFFITNCKDNVLLTIQSRCQIINLKYDVIDLYDELNISSEKYNKLILIVKEYLEKLEKDDKLLLLYNKNNLIDQLSDKEDLKSILKIVVNIYEAALRAKNDSNDFSNYSDFMFILNNSTSMLAKKLTIFINALNNINYNLNTLLLLDKIAIEMSEVHD